MLNGLDEGIRVQVSTTVSGAESPKLVLESVQNIFPDFTADVLVEPKFGTSNNYQWQNEQRRSKVFGQGIPPEYRKIGQRQQLRGLHLKAAEVFDMSDLLTNFISK